MTCPVCFNDKNKYGVKINTYSIIKCSECGLEYTTPSPSDEELMKYYASYSDIRANQEILLLNAQQQLKSIFRHGISDKSKILDFGAGSGVFVDMAECDGVEINPSTNKRIKQTIDQDDYDCITLWGVLEHLPRPLETLSDLVTHLRLGGLIAITTVNAEGEIPYYYKPPEHLTYWTSPAFDVLAKKCNLEIIEYMPYEMYQLGSVYLDRVLSRTPEEYKDKIINKLPRIVFVPTNEIFVVMRKI